jgi:hypothetical protein
VTVTAYLPSAPREAVDTTPVDGLIVILEPAGETARLHVTAPVAWTAVEAANVPEVPGDRTKFTPSEPPPLTLKAAPDRRNSPSVYRAMRS